MIRHVSWSMYYPFSHRWKWEWVLWLKQLWNARKISTTHLPHRRSPTQHLPRKQFRWGIPNRFCTKLFSHFRVHARGPKLWNFLNSGWLLWRICWPLLRWFHTQRTSIGSNGWITHTQNLKRRKNIIRELRRQPSSNWKWKWKQSRRCRSQ